MLVQTDSVWYNGDHITGFYNPGTYEIEVRAWADNDFDTGQFELLTVQVIDPCVSASLTIDDSVFKTVPDLTLLQFVNYEALQIHWTDSIIVEKFDTDGLCGFLIHEIWNMDTGT